MSRHLGVSIGMWLLVFLGAVSAFAQLETHTANIQTWDAVVCGPENVLLLAVYDRNEVWTVNPATGEALAKVRVGRGPVALALSADRRTVACLSHLDATVSLINLPELSLSKTVKCPKGSFAIVGLPDGRFAGASSFSNSLWVIDGGASDAAVVRQLDGVPNGLAVNDSFVAVTTVTPPGLLAFGMELALPVMTFPTDSAPVAITAFGANRFAVATSNALLLVDVKEQREVARAAIQARSLAVKRDGLAALEDGSVAILDDALTVESEIALPCTGFAVRVLKDYLVVLSPKTRAWYSQGALAAPAAVAKAAPAATSAPTVQPSIVEARAPDAKPAVAAPQAATREQGSARTPSKLAESPASDRRHTPPQEFKRSKKGISRLDENVKVSPGTALTPPDWTQPFRDIEADVWETQLGEEELSLKGNVHLSLDKMRFSADEFWYNEKTNEMRAIGKVLIVQDPAEILADEVYYRVAPPAEVPKAFILEPALSEQQRAKRQFSLGYFDAVNVTIRQPGQELYAEKMKYNIVDETGDLEDARGHAGIYYFGGKKLRILGPASMDGEDIWMTTCDRDPPHYRIRIKEAVIREGNVVFGKDAHLYIGEAEMPLYWPRWGYRPGAAGAPLNFDFDSGHRARIGYYFNTGMQFGVTPDAKLGLRLFPTTQEGVGLGLDAEYDFMDNPASPFFLSKGVFHSLYTTEDRGYLELRHRQEILDDTIMLLQVEQWSDRDFYKDFYWDQYKNRSEPRSFVNVTYTRPTYIATGTVRAETNGFVRETEQLPDGSYHLLQRPIAKNLYVSFDTINGYFENEPDGAHAARSVNIGRFTYDVNVHEALNLMPFVELEGTLYSRDLYGNDAATRLSSTFGVTLQSRFSKVYDGMMGFSGFKHVVVPSITYSYRPDSTMDVQKTPLFDPYDTMNGRSRFETKIDNVVFGRDAKTNRVWEVARLSLFQGNDLENEVRKMEDYEADLHVQPRPWWGWTLSAEHHRIDDKLNIDDPLLRDRVLGSPYGNLLLKPFQDDRANEYLSRYGDYNNMMTYLFYDDTYFNGKYNAKIGFAYTETGSEVYNREILYGLGYRLDANWGLAFEQRYDLERQELSMQKYQIRRNLHCWEAALTFRNRQTGWDFGIEFNITALPGTRLKF